MTVAQISPVEQLRSEVHLLESKLTERDQKIVYLEEQLAWLKRHIFGKKSERIVSEVNPQQLELEGFNQLHPAEEIPTKPVSAHTRRKPHRNGQDKITLPPDLPVVRVVLDLPEEQKICPETGAALVQIGEEVTHKLAHKPASYYIKEIVRPKYAIPGQEEAGIQVADLPDTLLPKCRADDSFLAEILVMKYADHLPLSRISEILGREQIGISRKLLSQWVVRCGMALEPLYNEMKKKVLGGGNIFIDETPVMMQAEKEAKQTYMWVIVGGEGSSPPYRVYDFRETRSHAHVAEMLEGYHGVVHSDKYGAYEVLAQKKMIIWSPCWAHIRRKFFEAEQGDRDLRAWVLRKIRYLFMLEKVAWARSPEERLRIRQEKEEPIIDELIEKIKARLTDGRILPKSKLREALGYFCGLIPYLKNYTKYAFARLDNNVAERAIRPLAIGRKNWIFFGSPDGGQAAAVILSLVQTCRGLGINPRDYLEDVMRRLMGHNAQKLHELLPDQWQMYHQKLASSTGPPQS